MATPSAAPGGPPTTPHRRSKTSTFISKLTPVKSNGHKKTASTSSSSTNNAASSGAFSPPNPLNEYMRNPNLPPQLPPLSTFSRHNDNNNKNHNHSKVYSPTSPVRYNDEYELEPPRAPFAEEAQQERDRDQQRRRGRMHKKSLSSMTMSFTSNKEDKKDKENKARRSQSRPRGSMDISDKLRDLVSSPNRRGSRASSPTGEYKEKKPKKSKSAIDIALLRRNRSPEKKHRDKENRVPQMTGEEGAADGGGGGARGYFRRSRGYSEVVPKKNSAVGEGQLDLELFERVQQDTPWTRSNRTSVSSTVENPVDLTSSPGYSSPGSAESSKKARRKEAEKAKKEAEKEEMDRRKYAPAELDRRQQYQQTGSAESSERSRGRSTKPRPKSMFASAKPKEEEGLMAPPRKSVDLRRSQDGSRKPLPDPPSPEKKSGSFGRNGANFDLDAIDEAFEKLLDSRDVPENRKDVMRKLPVTVKQEFVRGGMQIDKFPTEAPAPASPSLMGGLFKKTKTKTDRDPREKSRGRDDKSSRSISPSKRRPLSERFGKSSTSAGGASPTKKKADPHVFLPKTTDPVAANGPPSPGINITFTPEEWVSWLQEASRRKNFGQRIFAEGEGGKPKNSKQSNPDLETNMKDVSIQHLHKLRLVLRNEAIRWIESFLNLGGMEALWATIERVLLVEWREDHEDHLYHELLLCLKGLCTTSLALQKLSQTASIIFPRLLQNLFDESHKGPAEFTTRGLIISLLNVHLSTSPASQRPLRARRILSYLANKLPTLTRRPLDLDLFHPGQNTDNVDQEPTVPYTPRPYQNWSKEVSNVTKEVFWIFLHNSNTIPLIPPSSNSASYCERNFPTERPPQPAAAHVGGVEWEATNYIATHIDLLNGCIASLVSREERNEVRADLRNSGWEKVMGGALRLIKDKLHGVAVHEGLRTWVRAACEDGWDVQEVRFGVRQQARGGMVRRKTWDEEEERGRGRAGMGVPQLELAIPGDERDRGRREVSNGWNY